MIFHSPPQYITLLFNYTINSSEQTYWVTKTKQKKVDTYLYAKSVSGNHIVLKQAEHSAAFINISKSSQFRP